MRLLSCFTSPTSSISWHASHSAFPSLSADKFGQIYPTLYRLSCWLSSIQWNCLCRQTRHFSPSFLVCRSCLKLAKLTTNTGTLLLSAFYWTRFLRMPQRRSLLRKSRRRLTGEKTRDATRSLTSSWTHCAHSLINRTGMSTGKTSSALLKRILTTPLSKATPDVWYARLQSTPSNHFYIR